MGLACLYTRYVIGHRCDDVHGPSYRKSNMEDNSSGISVDH
jgi:hypothetical protein